MRWSIETSHRTPRTFCSPDCKVSDDLTVDLVLVFSIPFVEDFWSSSLTLFSRLLELEINFQKLNPPRPSKSLDWM